MKHLLMLGCFQAVEMTKGAYCQSVGIPETPDSSTLGYLMTNVVSGDVHWQSKEHVDRCSAVLPDNFSELPQGNRAWVAERALHAQRIMELEAELRSRAVHYRQNGTVDVFADNFIAPHIEALKQRVLELDEAIRCID